MEFIGNTDTQFICSFIHSIMCSFKNEVPALSLVLFHALGMRWGEGYKENNYDKASLLELTYWNDRQNR